MNPDSDWSNFVGRRTFYSIIVFASNCVPIELQTVYLNELLYSIGAIIQLLTYIVLGYPERKYSFESFLLAIKYNTNAFTKYFRAPYLLQR